MVTDTMAVIIKRFPRDLRRRLQHVAIEEERSMAEIMIEATERYVRNHRTTKRTGGNPANER